MREVLNRNVVYATPGLKPFTVVLTCVSTIVINCVKISKRTHQLL